MKFDFGTPRVIDAFKWYQSNNSNHGTWKWQGSDDDSVLRRRRQLVHARWTDRRRHEGIYAPLSGNPSAYRYWKMVQVERHHQRRPVLYEIEFKIY